MSGPTPGDNTAIALAQRIDPGNDLVVGKELIAPALHGGNAWIAAAGILGL